MRSGADVFVPENPVGDVRQHQIGQTVGIPICKHRMRIAHIVMVFFEPREYLAHIYANRFAFRHDRPRRVEDRLFVVALVDKDAYPPVSIA